MSSLDGLQRVQPGNRQEWRDWLLMNYRKGESVWLVLPKKGSGLQGVTLGEAVDEAICFGWIDSLPRKLDDKRSMLLISPRKRGSNWSTVNKRKAERLIASGKMHPVGLAKIDEAKSDGSWDALDEVEQLIVPDDLKLAFEEFPGAGTHWDGFPPSARRGILEWILNAKRPETRQKRVNETARLAQDNIRANQWPRKQN